MNPQAGQKIGPKGRFLLEGSLGVGGMGFVFQALDTRLKRKVAIKFLRSEFCDSNEGWYRLKREARSLAALNHPGLPAIYRMDLEVRPPYIIQELLIGCDLNVTFRNSELLSPEETRALAREMAETLSYIHERELLHRDIKPANIFREENGHFRLMDFGLAKAIDATTFTKEDSLVGTMLYLPFEVISGLPFTKSADVYQLGLVLHMAITGRHLHGTPKSINEYIAELRREGWRRATPDSAIPPDLQEVIEQCCGLRPEDRPSDGAALLELLNGKKSRGKTRAVLEPIGKTKTLNPRSLLPLLIFVLLSLIIFILR